MEKIIVLDFGGQYTQLIAKKVRNAGVYSEILPYSASSDEIKRHSPKGIILSGGPSSVYEKDAPLPDKNIFSQGLPVLGICYGMQVISYLMGGELVSEGVKEYGETKVYVKKSNIFNGLKDDEINAWMSHGDSVKKEKLPLGFEIIAITKNHVAGIQNESLSVYGVQFHPEVGHTQNGEKIISNFLEFACGCSFDWTPTNFIEECKNYIRETVGKNNVICFVSGGVDSSFVAALLSQTEGIGKVYPIYIEGLMRKNETREVEQSLKSAGVEDLIVYRAESEFIDAVKGLYEPEEKRKAIGNLFGKLQEKIANDLGLKVEDTFLAQGTLYTDLIESGHGTGKNASNIKSHHNVGCDFIERLRKEKRLVEPNKWIFKDEVRKAAKEIGLPPNIYNREPFPGPGLGIRIVDGRKDWETEVAGFQKEAQEIAQKHGFSLVVVPVKTVGVQGDFRTYRFVAVLRGPRDWEKIREAAKEIPMKVEGINRVVYELNPSNETKAYEKIKAIETRVNKENIDTLKEIDFMGRKIISEAGVELSQTIFILFGADLCLNGKRSVALRGVFTDDFMTVRPAKAGSEISWETLDKIDKMVKEFAGSFVIDVTDKPPATTCWE